MKTKNVLLLTVLLGLSSSLISCGGSSGGDGGNTPEPYVVPTDSYSKVKTAFNGVEKSFRNVSNKSLAPKYGLSTSQKEEGALSDLFSLFTSADSRGSSLDDLEYDQPPMIQFQYLKKVLEVVGESYSFGTKYYDTIRGDIYVDFETGFEDKDKKEENKYAYTFGLSIDVDIDESDLITAEVSFDINLAKGTESYTTQWYVSMELDYDMEKASPNYTMKMITDNNEVELPFRNIFVFEYDYVEVKDSSIKEWRKFCLSSSQRLDRNDVHPTFASYASEDDFSYTVDCFAWYKDGTFYKNNNIKDQKRLTFGESLFTGLELNHTDINPEAFFNRQGTVNSKIKDIYGEFSRIYGKDIIYDLVTSDEDDHGGHHGEDVGELALITWTTNEEFIPNFPNNVIMDTNIHTLFNDPNAWSEGLYPVFKFLDANGATIEKTNDLSLFNMYLILEYGNSPKPVLYEISEETLVKDLFDGVANYTVNIKFVYKENTDFELELQMNNSINQGMKGFYGFPKIKFDAAGWGEYFPYADDLDDKFSTDSGWNGYTTGYMQVLDTNKENESVSSVIAYTKDYQGLINSYKEKLSALGFENESDDCMYLHNEELNGTFRCYFYFDVGYEPHAEFKFSFKPGDEPGGDDPEIPTDLVKLYVAIGEWTDYACNLSIDPDLDYYCRIDGNEIIPYEIDADTMRSIFMNVEIYGSKDYRVFKENQDIYYYYYDQGMPGFTYLLYFSYGNNSIKSFRYFAGDLNVNFMITGDFCNWSFEPGMPRLFDRYTTLDTAIVSELTLFIEEGQGFKVVKNYDWNQGNWGYKLLRGNEKDYFYNGDNENITAKASGQFTFRINIDFNFDGECLFNGITLVNAEVYR